MGSVVVAHGLSCSAACGIFPDQGSNPCLLHRQADSQPLHHQGRLEATFFCIAYLNISLFNFHALFVVLLGIEIRLTVIFPQNFEGLLFWHLVLCDMPCHSVS